MCELTDQNNGLAGSLDSDEPKVRQWLPEGSQGTQCATFSQQPRRCRDDGAGDHVARAILALLALVDPDMIVLGGSIGARAEFITRVESKVLGTWGREVRLVRSQSGGRAGLLGALELARRHMLEEMFGA